MRKLTFSLLGWLLCCVCLVSPGISQTLAECTSPASDTDGDGYGWENNESCIVLEQQDQCEDRGGYPWGWNPMTLESCRLDALGTCIDTAPLNDGWGWNGITSCRIAEQADVYRCDDNGAYPWGWNSTLDASCRLDLVNSPEVVSYNTPNLETVSENLFIDVPLMCKRVLSEFFCDCDGSVTDNLANPQEIGDIFYTATLRNLDQMTEFSRPERQSGTYQTMTIDGSWQDHPSNDTPLYSDERPGLSYNPPGENGPTFFIRVRPSFAGVLSYLQNAQGDIFMKRVHRYSSGSDLTTISHCVR